MTGIGTGTGQARGYDLSAGLTVREALNLPCLGGARLVAGARGGARRIRVVNIMEVPDIVRWMRGGELLLTTAYAVRDDAAALTALVPTLAGRGLAALGVKIGPYLPELPPEMLALGDRLGFPVIALPGDVMFNDILSEVLGTVLNRHALELEQSRALHERLTAVAVEGGSYQELMNVLLELSGCAAAVHDPQGAVLASAGAPPRDVPATATRPLDTGLRRGGAVALWAEGGARLTPHQRMALDHATTVACMITAQEQAAASRQQHYRTTLLTDLVSRAPRDRADTLSRAAALGWNLRLPRAAVLLEATAPDGSTPLPGPLFEERLLSLVRGAAGPQALLWGNQTGLAGLLEPGDSLPARCQALHTAVTAAHPDWNVVVAAGTEQSDFAAYHRSYEEAVQTLGLGREVHGDDFVRTYADMGVYRLLGQVPSAELRRMVDDALGPLIDHDARTDGALVETLGAYLLQDRNGVAAAARLHIHYNTLRYRLRQIERLTGGLERHAMARIQTELAVYAKRLLAVRESG
ncbi:PucR family transcriptional regulator ligand-binding domain-containing protein [Streptomyces sp. HUAS MG91]|uniref:PucR family transcriptional regulator ligand-binding domain-containing protein n=1 Tax=Streptomyces tabacisoli TaxID=3156398 RepID=A0AAU8INE3_9ACTN